MNKKIGIIVLVGIVVAALVALAWWWFLGRPQPTPAQTGTFGTAQNVVPGSNTGGGPQTNIGSPVMSNTNGAAGTLTSGSYIFKTPNGQMVGTYDLNANPSGGYTITSTDGSGVLASGTYSIGTADQVFGDYTVNQTGSTYTVDLVPFSGTASTTNYGQYGFASTTNYGQYGFASTTDLGQLNLGGVDWLSASSTNNAGTIFNPTGINQINNSNPTGGVLPNIGGGYGGSGSGSNGGIGLAGALAGAAVAAGVSCAAFLISSPVGALSLTLLASVQINDSPTNVKGFLDCTARTIARIALQQVTNSVVNWINSGFSGSPAFVTNPQQFFANVADIAAGQYIQGSNLSFLCSPFQLQIRIAIAQSYANRYANSCTLTRVVGNINNFMNGDFSAGGWGGLLAFTTVPTNNPYGAYAYASIGLNTAVNNALTQKIQDWTNGRGFLSFQKQTNCKPMSTLPTGAVPSASVSSITLDKVPNGAVAGQSYTIAVSDSRHDQSPSYEVCDVVATTPGSVIEAQLNNTIKGASLDSLGLAQSFDQIISALMTQLITRALYGLSDVSNGSSGYSSNFYTSDQLTAQSSAQGVLTQLQSDVGTAQQLGSIEQGSIQDIQNVQTQLNDLYNCWNNAAIAAGSSGLTITASSTTVDPAAQALANATQASTTILYYQNQVNLFNSDITAVNSSIALLEGFQSRALSAASSADVDSITSDYNAAKAQGQIFTQTDLVTAQQNRTTLQNALVTLNQQTSGSLTQCYAFAP